MLAQLQNHTLLQTQNATTSLIMSTPDDGDKENLRNNTY
jgi:hypothetical protein